jgi:hypothetical protein
MQYMGLTVEEGRTLMPGDTYAIVFGAHMEREFELMGSTWENRANRNWEWQWQGRDIPTFVDVMRAPMRISHDSRFVQAALDEQLPLTGGIRPIPSQSVEVVGLLAPSNDWSVNNTIYIDAEVLLQLNMEQALFQKTLLEQQITL